MDFFAPISDEAFAKLDFWWDAYDCVADIFSDEEEQVKQKPETTINIELAQVVEVRSNEYKPTTIIPGPLKPIIKKQIKRGSPIPPLFQRFNK